MASEVKVRYNCGCGFVTDTLEEAVRHCDLKKHTLTVSGEVRCKEEG